MGECDVRALILGFFLVNLGVTLAAAQDVVADQTEQKMDMPGMDMSQPSPDWEPGM
jgi:hypothetical protein